MGVVLGFGGGFFAGYFTHKKINDVQFEIVSDEEMQELVEKESSKHNKGDKTDSDISQDQIDSVEAFSNDPDRLRIALQGKVSYLDADNEAKAKNAEIWGVMKDYSNEDNANMMPVETHKEEVKDEIPNESDDEEGFDEDFIEQLNDISIYPISFEEYYNGRKEYDKISIGWYEDSTFIDEKEDIIPDIQSYIGEIDINKLFEDTKKNEDPDIRFVRNEDYGSDYEIIRHHRTWSETIGGSE